MKTLTKFKLMLLSRVFCKKLTTVNVVFIPYEIQAATFDKVNTLLDSMRCAALEAFSPSDEICNMFEHTRYMFTLHYLKSLKISLLYRLTFVWINIG